MLCVHRWSDAGLSGKYNVESPKQGIKTQKVQLYYKDDPLCPFSYIFIYA